MGAATDVQTRSSTSSYYKMRPICCSFCYKKRSRENSHAHLALLWPGRYGTALVPCLVFLNAKRGAFGAISPKEAHSINYETRAYQYRRLLPRFLISDHSVSLFGISPPCICRTSPVEKSIALVVWSAPNADPSALCTRRTARAHPQGAATNRFSAENS